MNRKIECFRTFFTGKLYPILASLLIFLGHATGYEVVFAAILMLSLIPPLLLCHDLRFAILPSLALIFLVSVKDYQPSDPGYAARYLNLPVLITAGVVLLLLFAALLWFIVRNRAICNPFPKKGIFLSLSILCVAFFCNGLFSANYTPKNLAYALATTASLLVLYVLFALFVQFDRSSVDYLMYCLVLAGLIIAAELIFAYFTTVQFENGEIVKGSVVLGWGVWTNIGGMLAFLMPACFYFARSHKLGWVGFLLGLLEYFCIVLSQSRGALLVGTVILGLCLVYLFFSGRNKKRNRVFTAGIFLCGVAVMILFSDKLLSLLQNFLSLGFSDNGRFEMWRAGFGHFLDYPIFGSGFYDSYDPSQLMPGWNMGIYPYLYHNTPVQLLGACGLVGALAYLYHRICTVRLVIRRPDPKKTFLGLCVLALVLFCLTDVLFFKTYPTLYYSVILLFIEKTDEINQKEKQAVV